MNIINSTPFYPHIPQNPMSAKQKEQAEIYFDDYQIRRQKGCPLPDSTPAARLNKAQIEANKIKEEGYFEFFLNTKGKVTKEEYEEIKKNHPQLLLMADKYCESYRLQPKELANFAKIADDYLKKNFQNYRIISIGVSPAPLCEQLANMGHEVIFLPAKGLRALSAKELINNKNYSPELMCLLEYLSNKGVDNNKTNVFIDLFVTGSTLENATKMVKDKLKIDEDKIISLPLQKIFDSNMNKYVRCAKEYLFEEISNVPHFPVTSQLQQSCKTTRHYKQPVNQKTMVYYDDYKTNKELFKVFDEYSTPLARAFSLATMNKLDI